MCSPAKNLEFLNAVARPAAEQKLFHSVGNRRQLLCSDMSGFKTRGPTFPHLRIFVKEIRQGIQTSRKHDYVRIHQRDIAPLALADGYVVALGEAKILVAPDEFDVRKLRFDHLRRAVD